MVNILEMTIQLLKTILKSLQSADMQWEWHLVKGINPIASVEF